MLELTPSKVRSYARAGFIQPRRGPRGEYRFTFQELVLLRTAKGLAAARIPPRRLRKALRRLKRQLPSGRPLSAVKIRAQGERLVVHEGESLWDPESGQGEFNFEVAELVKKIEPHAKRAIAEALGSAGRLDADAWYQLGFDLESAAPEQAREAYRHAVEINPAHADEAMQAYREAIAADPKGADAYFNLARLDEKAGESQAALRYLKAYRRLSS